MFDTNKVASNIKNSRTKMNMTQMNLADRMGVSYQAVSNWERGNSMPDISKLPELCKILNISFEQLVGEKSAETDTVEKLMQDKIADVSLEEMAQIGQLVEPDKVESKINETIESGKKIPFSVLVNLSPFLDKETLSRMAEETADIDLNKLCAIAPFIKKETTDKIVDKNIQSGNVDVRDIVGIAPFIKKETMDKIVDKNIQSGNVDMHDIMGIAPFLSKTAIQKIAEYLIEHGDTKNLAATAPFISKEMFSHLKFDYEKKTTDKSSSGNAGLDDMDENDVAEIAFGALELGNDVAEYLDYMNEDDVAKLAVRALESDKQTEIFLDYMDEDDVEKLAFKALEAGKPIDCYLDFMSEDGMKKLLLQLTKK